MPDPMDPRTPDAWQPPDPDLAEALRAYGFEASPPALDDEPGALPGAIPMSDLSAADGAGSAPAYDPVDDATSAWWVESVLEPPAPVVAAAPVTPIMPVPPAVAPRPAAVPTTPGAAAGPTPPPSFLAARLGRAAAVTAASDSAVPEAVLEPEAVAEPEAVLEPAVAAADDARLDDPRDAIAWPDAQPLNDEPWRDGSVSAPVADTWPAEPGADAGRGLAFESWDTSQPDAPVAQDPWAGVIFSADEATPPLVGAVPGNEPLGDEPLNDEPLDAVRAEATAWFAADTQVDADDAVATPVDALTPEGQAPAADQGDDTLEDAPPDAFWPGPDATTSPFGTPAPWDTIQDEPDDALPLEPSAQPTADTDAPVDPWAQPQPSDSWPIDPAAAVPLGEAPTSEPAWVAPPPVPPVEYVGYTDATPVPAPGLSPVVAVPPVADAGSVIAAPAPSTPIQPPGGSILDIGRRPPGARPVPAAAPPTTAAVVAAGATAPPPAAPEAAPAAAEPPSPPVSAPGPDDRVAAPDPSTAAGTTSAAMGSELWDLVTAPPATTDAKAPAKTSRAATLLLTLLVVLVIVALVIGFAYMFLLKP